jgi:hypothetical protein
MNEDLAKIIIMLAAVNVAAAIVMVPLSYIVSAWALNGLEKLDLWMSRTHKKNSFRIEPRQ